VVKFLLVVALVVDGALAALLVGVSGFLFGGGPESMRAGVLAGIAYTAAVIACLAAPIVGFILNKRGKSGAGLAVAWLPVAGALIVLMIPAPY
jgi:hypothetical protein